MTEPLPPLRFERRFLEKVWGGRSLATNPGFELPPDVPIGETWEVVDRADENSLVADGPLAGTSLRALMEAHGEALLGTAAAGKQGRFPLLVKYIDAADDLSVQVHPDDATAKELGGAAEAKTEAWVVLDVRPGAKLYCGLRDDVTPAEFARSAQTPAVVDTLLAWDVQPGDCVLVPGGTVHAIGRGITLLEVQQNSDTTYRIWDWGRMGLDGKPRATHVEAALACIRFGRPPVRPVRARWVGDKTCEILPLSRSSFFAIDAVALTGAADFSTGGRFRLVATLHGAAGLFVAESGTKIELRRGDVWLLPATTGAYTVAPRTDAGRPTELLHFDPA